MDELQTPEELIEEHKRMYLDRLWFTFAPRKDQPERYDEQTAFMESKHAGITFLLGGNGAGCLGGEERLWCHRTERWVSVSAGESLTVKTPTGRLVEVNPRKIGVAPLYEVKLSNGDVFVATLHHRVMGADRLWSPLQDIASAQPELLRYGLSHHGGRVPGQRGRLGSQITQGLMDRCSGYCRRCGEPLPQALKVDPVWLTSPLDVLGHGRPDRRGCSSSLLTGFDPLSSFRFVHPSRRSFASEPSLFATTPSFACSRPFAQAGTAGRDALANSLATGRIPVDQLFAEGSCRWCTSQSFHPGATGIELASDYPFVVGLRYLRTDSYYDFEVPGERAYWHKGLIHHNTTTCALMKALRFMLLEQEAPRPGTPFLVISENLEMAMDTCFKEKMYSRGMLPMEEVQWDRISWYRPRMEWPKAVPLKPRPGSKNYWTIQFKSYDQGRAAMQASSIGGFVFVEQCPWGILEEVFRGARDYPFKGNKIAEFTPIDPALSAPLEEMIQEDRVPDSYGIYRANTTCSMEAGHVTKEWYDDFFGMVSDDMRETRTTGAFAGYDGLIYPRVQPKFHFMDEEEMAERLHANMIHKRAIDWGGGPENAMVMLWGAKEHSTQTWYIYDEYYSTDQSCTLIDHLNNMNDMHEWPDTPNYQMTYADPSDPLNIRTANGFPSRDQKRTHSLRVTAAYNEVMEGIESVREKLKIWHGEPRLIISKRCKKLMREIQIYRWMKSAGVGLNPQAAKPAPLKRDDHTCDALRYLIHSDLRGAQKGAKAGKSVPKNRKRFIRSDHQR